jgi:hypothetical protein
MNAQHLKLSAALICFVILSSCGGLPIGFGFMSEQERLKIGTDALMASCVESDVERANEYLAYVATVTKEGDLSSHLSQEVLTKCLTGSLEGSPQGKVSEIVYRYGTDAHILAALKIQFTVRKGPEICEYFNAFYAEDIAKRVSKIVCDDPKVTRR